MAPKRERLELALKSLREKEIAYNEAVIQLQKLRSELESLQQMYDAKMKEKEDLIRLVSTWKALLAISIFFYRLLKHVIMMQDVGSIQQILPFNSGQIGREDLLRISWKLFSATKFNSF